MRVVGVDIGGTFTDLMLYDTSSGSVHVHKVPSTPAEPERAMVSGLTELCASAGLAASDLTGVFHGTTVATNAVLEHEGAVAGMITTRGFRDVVHIGRHQRALHYSVMQDIPWQAKPFVQRRHRKVVTERIVPPTGEVLVPLDEEEVRTAARELREEGVEAVAVCFLFSYLNPEHERRAAAIVRDEMPDAFVTTSADIVPQFREFERFTTAAMSAFVGPKIGHYLERLAGALEDEGVQGELHVMMSSGGVASVHAAAERPVTLLLSGPAAGILGGEWAGALAGRRRLITFDMGGTSADIGIVTEDGVSEATARDTWVGGYPLLVPMLDVHAIGAGGGSIAYVDEGGAFRVGPRSAGAVPGPACYGHGGTEPTVTDAHAVLGRLDPEHFLGGNMKLHPERAHEVVRDLAARLGMEEQEAAAGIVTILNSNMANATHAITTQKGHDPREFSLVAFGGAGPLHAAEVARILGVKEVIIPAYPGINSAIGLLTTDLKYDAIATQFTLSTDPDLGRLNEDLERLEGEVRAQLKSDGIPEADISVLRGVDCRYVGQGYELRVALPEGRIDEDNVGQVWQRMHDLHRLEYGHAFPDNPIELVNLRVSGVGRTPKITEVPVSGERSLQRARLKEREVRFRVGESLESVPTVFYERDLLPVGERVEGTAVVVQGDTTTVLPPGASGALDEEGNLILELREV